MSKKKIIIAGAAVAAVVLIIFLLFMPRRADYNVVLVSIDTLRADHLGCYGYPLKTSPNLDEFSRSAVLFENAIVQTSWTLPSHMSILTSLYPSTHKVVQDVDRLDERVVTVAQMLKKNGYSTAAFVDAPLMESKYGFDRGFDLYYESYRLKDRYVIVGIENNIGKVMSWIRNNSGNPFFLFLHIFDCHSPYLPPDMYYEGFAFDYGGGLEMEGKSGPNYFNRVALSPEDVRYIVSHYDGEIASVDHQLGKMFDLLEESGLAGKTLVIVTSDHGESFMEHGMVGHEKQLYNELMRVPLIMRFPGGRYGGERIRAMVESIDIVPTILDLLGIAGTGKMQGISLLPLIRRDEKEADGGRAFGELSRHRDIRTVYEGGYQYIYDMDNNKSELYDLAEDPAERKDLSGVRKDRAYSMHGSMMSWAERAKEDGEGYVADKTYIDDKQRDLLKSLGYMD